MTEGVSPRQNKSTGSDPRPTNDRIRATVFVVMYLLITVLALGLPLALRGSRTKSMTYSDFLQLLRTKQVTEVTDESKPFAEDTARLIDAEIKQLIVDAHIRASDILRERRDVLRTLACRLMEQEVVEGADVRALLEHPPAASASQAAA